MIFSLLTLGLNFADGDFWLTIAEVTVPNSNNDIDPYEDNSRSLLDFQISDCRVKRFDLFYLRLI